MGKKAKRARTMLKKMSILGEKIEPKILRRFGLKAPEDYSVMQEKIKREVSPPMVEEEKVDVAPDTNFTPDIAEEMTKEVKEMVKEIKSAPRLKTKTKPRTPRRTRKKKAIE